MKEYLDRFMNKVEKTDSCWIWKASFCKGKNLFPYGHFKLNGKVRGAHRVSYEIYNGNIPDKMNVLHKCDNPKCVNPDHLYLGTQKDNIKDMHNKKRFRSTKGKKRLSGPNHGNSKLTTEELNYIICMNKKRFFLISELAKHFGVSQSLISQIINKKGSYSWLI